MEITFAQDGWAIAAFICFLAFVAMCGLSGTAGDSLKTMVKVWSIAFIVLYGIGTGIGAVASAGIPSPTTQASSAQLLNYFGLENGKRYPLILSDTNGSGIIGEAQTSAGWFGSQSTIDLRPTSTISLGFNKGDSWRQMTLPTDTIDYRKGASKPSMSILVNDESLGDPSYAPAYWYRTWSGCNWEYHNFWFTCMREIETERLVVTDEAKRAGPSGIVQQYFESAVIKLTDEQHAELFPTN